MQLQNQNRPVVGMGTSGYATAPPISIRGCTMPPRKRARKVSNEPDTVKLETELEQLTCEQLRQELLDIGENPGPIDLATK